MNYPEEYKTDIDKAISILKAAGCSEIYLFGSLASGESNPDSDIDLAVKGIKKGDFFRVMGKLIASLNCKIDLVDMDKSKAFVKHIFHSKNILRLA